MFKMSNKVYDVLKEIALTILPALAVLYAHLVRFGDSLMLGKCPPRSWQSTPFSVCACTFPTLNIRKRVRISE